MSQLLEPTELWDPHPEMRLQKYNFFRFQKFPFSLLQNNFFYSPLYFLRSKPNLGELWSGPLSVHRSSFTNH